MHLIWLEGCNKWCLIHDGFESVCVQTSEDVAEYNIISMLHEILHREKYCRPTEAETKAKEESSDNGNEDKENKAQSKTNEEKKAKQDKAKETSSIETEQDSVIETGTEDTKATESKAEETTNEAKRAEESDVEATGTQEPEVRSDTVAKAGMMTEETFVGDVRSLLSVTDSVIIIIMIIIMTILASSPSSHPICSVSIK